MSSKTKRVKTKNTEIVQGKQTLLQHFTVKLFETLHDMSQHTRAALKHTNKQTDKLTSSFTKRSPPFLHLKLLSKSEMISFN